MKLISKKEVQALRSREIDKANLDKDKVDRALSESIRRFNEWKEQKKEEEKQIIEEFKETINKYNIQIEDLLNAIKQLKKERDSYMIPINQLYQEAETKEKEAEKKLNDYNRFYKELEIRIKKIQEKENELVKIDQKNKKLETFLEKEKEKIKKNWEMIRIAQDKLLKDKLDFQNWKEKEKEKINTKLDEIRIKLDVIASQSRINQEQKIQIEKEKQKIKSDREALNAAWNEFNKLR